MQHNLERHVHGGVIGLHSLKKEKTISPFYCGTKLVIMCPSSACASDITPSTFHASCKFAINEDVYWPEMAMLSLWGS